MKKIFLITISLLITLITNSQTVTVNGNVFLENQSDHSNVQIELNRVAPSSLQYTTTTNSSGYYQIDIETGIYNISITKPTFLCYEIGDKQLYNTTTISDVDLSTHHTTINVPSDIPEIQMAINCASDGDTILIDTGVYYERIDFLGKDIVVASKYLTTYNESYVSNTVIDGNHEGRVVQIKNNETLAAQLIGLTIQNGYASELVSEKSGGGVYCSGSEPTLKKLRVIDNSSSFRGAGIYCENANVTVDSVHVEGNYLVDESSGGGGIYLYNSSSLITNSTIINNSSSGSAASGITVDNHSDPILKNLIISGNTGQVAIDVSHYCNPQIINSIITNSPEGAIHARISSNVLLKNSVISNCSEYYVWGVIALESIADMTITNSILANNNGNLIYNLPTNTGSITVRYSDIWNNSGVNFTYCNQYLEQLVTTNANGDSIDAFNNLYIDPVFEDTINFKLQSTSPCIDAGNNTDVDYDDDHVGNNRIFDGDNNGSDIVDMGAFEFGSSEYAFVEEIISNTNLLIYPNPSNGKITVKAQDIKSIEVYTLQGKKVQCQKSNIKGQNCEIDLSAQPKGFYIIKVQTSRGVAVEKLIME